MRIFGRERNAVAGCCRACRPTCVGRRGSRPFRGFRANLAAGLLRSSFALGWFNLLSAGRSGTGLSIPSPPRAGLRPAPRSPLQASALPCAGRLPQVRRVADRATGETGIALAMRPAQHDRDQLGREGDDAGRPPRVPAAGPAGSRRELMLRRRPSSACPSCVRRTAWPAGRASAGRCENRLEFPQGGPVLAALPIAPDGRRLSLLARRVRRVRRVRRRNMNSGGCARRPVIAIELAAYAGQSESGRAASPNRQSADRPRTAGPRTGGAVARTADRWIGVTCGSARALSSSCQHTSLCYWTHSDSRQPAMSGRRPSVR